jgi:hypothetical protein
MCPKTFLAELKNGYLEQKVGVQVGLANDDGRQD